MCNKIGPFYVINISFILIKET